MDWSRAASPEAGRSAGSASVLARNRLSCASWRADAARAPLLLLVIALSALGAAPSLGACPTWEAAVARYADTTVSLAMVEAFAGELPLGMVSPEAGSREWIEQSVGLLATRDLLASRALQMQLHQQPAFRQEVDRFADEFLSYLVLRDAVLDHVVVGENEITDFYRSRPQDFGTTAQLMIRVLRTRDAVKAASAMRRLGAGESFEAVEQDLSEMSARTRGKVLGPYPPQNGNNREQLANELFETALALELGQFSRPVRLSGYYYIVKLEERTPRAPVPIEAAREPIRNCLRAEKAGRVERQLLSALRELATTQSAAAQPVVAEVLPGADDQFPGRFRASVRAVGSTDTLTRFDLLSAAGRALTMQDQPEYVVATKLFELQRLADLALSHEIARRLATITEDQVTSYLQQMRAVAGRSGYSKSQRAIARAELEKQASGALTETVHQDTLRQAGVSLADTDSLRASAGPTLREAVELARQALSPEHASLPCLHAETASDTAPTSAAASRLYPVQLRGESGLVPEPCLPAALFGRSQIWTVTFSRPEKPPITVTVQGNRAQLESSSGDKQ